MSFDKFNFRYERKFLITDLSFKKVEKIIKFNISNFRVLYPERTINNIYFDNHSLQSFHDNVDGIAKREKIRIRWYGSMYGFVTNPILEIKKRNNSVGTKEQYLLNDFIVDDNFNESVLKELISTSNVPNHVKEKVFTLSPKIFNSYERKYYISFDNKFRVTLDKNLFYMRFMKRNKFLDSIRDIQSTVLEIKYDMENDSFINEITKDFNFRLTKNSKYVTGIFNLYF